MVDLMKKHNEKTANIKEERALAQEEAEKGSHLRGQLVTGKRKDMLQVMASQEDDEQPQVSARFKKWAKQSDQQLDFDIAVTMLLVSCNLPFNLVERQGFKNLISFVQEPMSRPGMLFHYGN